jgi:hypothetical protein
MRLSTHTPRAALLAVCLLVLGACGDDDTSSADAVVPDSAAATSTSSATEITVADDDHPDGGGATEVSSPVRRLAITDADAARLVLVDLDDEGAETEVDLPATASFASAVSEDGRLLLLAHEGAVTIVDGGSWSTAHADHFHHFVDEPAVIGTVDGERPTHLISHGGTAALWFDGLGEAVLFDEAELAEGHFHEEARVPTAAPHHGFAIPHGDHVVITAPPEPGREMPDLVVLADRSGAIESEHDCVQTHGETSWSTGAAAACGDGVLVLRVDGDEWVETRVAYPEVDDADPYGYGDARAWVLDSFDDGAGLAAPFGERHVLVVDLTSGEVSAVDMGAPVEIFGVTVHEPSGLLVVLTTDGALQLVDPVAGEVVDRVEVMEPTTDDEGVPYRMLVVSGDDIFVSDPQGAAVAELTLVDDGLVVGHVHDLGFTPAFIGVLNG